MKKTNYFKPSLMVLLICLGFNVFGQTVSLTGTTPYTQGFNTTTASLPSGWAFLETGTGADTSFASGNGTVNSGNTYFLGVAGEWAFGGLQSGSVNPIVGVAFTNNTGAPITELLISYKGETWRVGTVNRPDRLDFQYSTSATTLNNGTWVDVNTLDYANPGQAVGQGSQQHSANISASITGLNIANGATFRLRWTDFNASGADDAMGVDDFNIQVVPAEIVYDNGAWSDSPTIDDDVIIRDFLYVGTGSEDSFEAKSITVESDGAVYIEEGFSITAAGKITNEATAVDFIVESGASLVQTTAYTGTNTGDITIYRNSGDLVPNDVTFWASPVIGQNLLDFAAVVPYAAEDVWSYDTANDAYIDATDILFQSGSGYAMRSSTFTGTHTAEFAGVPFNGNVTFTGIVAGLRYNLVGNPYASPIDALDFLNGNTDLTRLLFWTHISPLVNGTYASGNYAHYTSAGGVAASAGGETPNGQIQIGQGFLARIRTGGSTAINFTNDMRIADNENQFYKDGELERHRIWMNLKSDIANHNQLMIAYMEGATPEADNRIDASFMNYNGNAIYSMIADSKYVIQGKGLPFVDSDVVPLGLKVVTAGNFEISIASVDGLFAEGEVKVYLKDKSLDLTHNLSESPYTFTAEIGEFNERFEIVYETEEVMGTEDLTANSVQIYKNGQNIVVESKSEKILSVELFDLSGRNIHRNDKVNTNIYQIKSNSKGVLVVRVQTTKGEIVTKKVINN